MGAVSRTQQISPQERAKQAEFVKQLREKQQLQKTGEQNTQAGQVDTQKYQLGNLGSVQPTPEAQQIGFVPAVEAPKIPERPTFATVQGTGGETIVDGNQGKGMGRVLAEGRVDGNGVHRDINDTNYTNGLGHDKYTWWYAA